MNQGPARARPPNFHGRTRWPGTPRFPVDGARLRANVAGRMGAMDQHQNLLGEPAATHLPEDPRADAALEQAGDPADVAAGFPAYSAAWAARSEEHTSELQS